MCKELGCEHEVVRRGYCACHLPMAIFMRLSKEERVHLIEVAALESPEFEVSPDEQGGIDVRLKEE